MDDIYDIFISYSHRDAEIASELASRLHDSGFQCFVAERDITATQQWEPRIRDAILRAKVMLILLTPRSIKSTWVAIETGAAWVLEKDIIPATMFVETAELSEPINHFQIRPIETSAQVTTLIQELLNVFSNGGIKDISKANKNIVPTASPISEVFGNLGEWDRLLKIGEWTIDEKTRVFRGQNPQNFLLSYFIYGKQPFRVIANLRFSSFKPINEIAAINAGIIFGWRSEGDIRRHYHLMFTGKRLLLELIGSKGGPAFRDFKHIDEGVPFDLLQGRYYFIELSVTDDKLSVKIDNNEIYTVSFPGDAVGRVGLRPWRSQIESDNFQVIQGE